MKIEITGEPKEIAALVLAVQERQPQSALVPKRVIEGSVNADHAVTSNNSVKDFGCCNPFCSGALNHQNITCFANSLIHLSVMLKSCD